MFAQTLDTLSACPSIADVIVVTDERTRPEVEECLPDALRHRVQIRCAPAAPVGTEVHALFALCSDLITTQDYTSVVIHRPIHALASGRLVASVIGALASECHIVVPAIPVVDSIKVVRDDGNGLISDAVDRDRVTTLQSPWGFSAAAIRRISEVPVTCRPDPKGGEMSVRKAFVTLVQGIAERLGCEVTTLPGEMQAIPMISLVDVIRAEIFHDGSAAFRKL